jgi:CDP-diacylglycerol--glycerol-3-phosphate 3-phosphatidyltransferase
MRGLANLITMSRAVMAFGVAWLVIAASEAGFEAMLAEVDGLASSDASLGQARVLSVAAFGLFVFAALTDALDGLAARAFDQVSELGALLDPIADKVLVIVSLIAVAIVSIAPDYLVLPPLLLITVRDFWMTLVRLKQRGAPHLKVSQLAKVKTALEFITVGLGIALAVQLDALLGFANLSASGHGSFVFVILLWLCAALSLWTAWGYRGKT